MASLRHYGKRLNRATRVNSVLFANKPLTNLVEANLTRATPIWGASRRLFPGATLIMVLMDKFGFPRAKAKQKRFRHGFRTGDLVRAVVPNHLKNAGTHVGRMSAKANGAFTLATAKGIVTDIGKKYCRCLQHADGYGYIQKGEAAFPPPPEGRWEETPCI